jgi:putative resolvase
VNVCLAGVVKLAVWARPVGVYPQTAYAWVREGRMSAPFRRLPSGTILVDVASGSAGIQQRVVLMRVASNDQRSDLDRQVGTVVWVGDR